LPGICHAQEDHKQQNFGKRSWCFQNFWFPICGKTKIMNAAETNILGMLHSQAILARSKELFADRSHDLTAGIRYNHIGPACNCNLLPEMHSKRAYYWKGKGAEWGWGRLYCGIDYGMNWRAAFKNWCSCDAGLLRKYLDRFLLNWLLYKSVERLRSKTLTIL